MLECALSVALRDRPGHAGSRLPRRGIDLEVYVAQDATRYRTRSSRGLKSLSYVASSLGATPENQRMPNSASLPSFGAALSRMLRSYVRPRSINRVASFLTQGNIACENILRARICTAVLRPVHKGAHISLVYCIGLQIVFSPYVRKCNSWLADKE